MYSRIKIGSTNYDSDKIYTCTYTHLVNSGEQLNVGVVSSAQLVFTTKENFAMGTSLTYFNKPFESSSYTQIGLFVIKDVSLNRDIYTYTAYDYASKLDTIVDTWFKGLTWPKTLAQLFSGVATACGLSYDTNFDGAPSSVSAPSFSAVNLRGRQIVQWIAQIAGGFAYVKTTGVLHIKHYGTASVKSFTNVDYTKLTIANYTAPAPDWIQVGKNNSGDVWNYTTSGVGTTGTNLIKIVGNPFTWGDDYSTTAAVYCFNIIGLGWIPSYTPFTLQALQDFGVNAGDKITINGTATIVMTKKIEASGVTFGAVGLKERSETTELQQQQIVYQSPQEWFDQGVSNSEGTSFGTSFIYFKNDGALYDTVEAEFGNDSGWPAMFLGQYGTGAGSDWCSVEPNKIWLKSQWNTPGYTNRELTLEFNGNKGMGLYGHSSDYPPQTWSITNEGVNGLGGCGTWNNSGGTVQPIASISGTATSYSGTFQNDLHYKAFILVLSLGRGDPDFLDSVYVPRLVFQRGHGGGAATVNLYSSTVKANGTSYPPLIPDTLKKCGDVTIALANNNSQNSNITINTTDYIYLVEVYGVYT